MTVDDTLKVIYALINARADIGWAGNDSVKEEINGALKIMLSKLYEQLGAD